MGKRINVINQKFGKLVVMEYAYTKKRKAYWKCQCNCGREIITTGSKLRNGHTKSCGCSRKETLIKLCRHDLTHRKFGRLTVLEYDYTRKKKVYWRCVCECGNEVTVYNQSLKSGNTKSCGCLQKESIAEIGKSNRTHGRTGTLSYKLSQNAKHRALKKKQTPELTENEKSKIQLLYQISEYLGEGWHVDHIVSLDKGGLHHPDNLQVTTKEYNLQKHNNENFRAPKALEYFKL